MIKKSTLHSNILGLTKVTFQKNAQDKTWLAFTE